MAWNEQFLEFERKIRLDMEGNEQLRKKRDALLARLRKRVPRPFSTFNQGSYALGTAVWPVDGGEVDIDVGVEFELDVDDDDLDPVDVKRWVLHAVDGHTSTSPDLRRNCVTAWYTAWERMPPCHVDLAVYARRGRGLVLAVGKESQPRDKRLWAASRPRELITAIRDKFQGSDRDQFRRVVRYLKRWKDVSFPSTGTSAPTGIAITTIAYHLFEPVPQDDLTATRALVEATRGCFEGGIVRPLRLAAPLPVWPRNDVLSRLTDTQMGELSRKLQTLSTQLATASRSSARDTRRILRACFGDDFPM